MKLGRTCAAAALLGAAALPLAAPISWADGTDAQPPAAAQQPAPPETRPAPGETRPAPPEARPVPSQRPDVARPTAEPTRGQVSQRPVGAPQTGGGPEESGINPVAVGGAAAGVIAVGGGAALALRRRRAAAN
ncbi:hypothetical protein MOQ72_12235 [Saccharopolyspora sp. K220]|uniref:hypothetical protein n=1 Tax=Saccharopolyspora soli TaxID=2926618 RepID=UPI001F56BA23|nr:hypothetical protein [Saccharopolyspora soli]MCI2418198.1 hypothetical protein [Saccharopolyspora soli]